MQALNKHLGKDGFRLRGTHMSRVDGFSDIVFGFAVTLLVVSLEVPKTYTELRAMLQGFIPFAISFLLLMIVWYAHYRFFRRYGTEDAGTLWLNGMLLFFVLFYVYPLKFLFRMAFTSDGALSSPHDARELTILYALGMAAIYTLIAALYANAWRQRDELELTPLERKLTILTMWDEGLVAVIALLAVLIACLLPNGHATMATMTFMLIGVSKTITGRLMGRASRKMHQHAK